MHSPTYSLCNQYVSESYVNLGHVPSGILSRYKDYDPKFTIYPAQEHHIQNRPVSYGKLGGEYSKFFLSYQVIF